MLPGTDYKTFSSDPRIVSIGFCQVTKGLTLVGCGNIFFSNKKKDVHYLFMYRRLACIQVLLNKKFIFLYYNAKN